MRSSCTRSLMVQFTFFTFGNIEKKTKMLSADVQKFVAKLDALLVSRSFSSLCCSFIACCLIVSSSFLVLHKCNVITHLHAGVIQIRQIDCSMIESVIRYIAFKGNYKPYELICHELIDRNTRHTRII